MRQTLITANQIKERLTVLGHPRGRKVALGLMKKQQTVIDLNTLEEVTIGKEPKEFKPVKNVHEANERLNNNAETLTAVINEGLRAMELRAMGADPSGWYELNDDNTVNKDKPFNGVMANRTVVNAMILTMAKSVFDYAAVDSKEHRTASKAKAREFVMNSPVIREGLKKSAAITGTEEE